MTKKLLLVLCLTLSLTAAFAQQKVKDGTVGGANLPNKDAILELESSNKGLLHSRVALKLTTDFAPLTAHVPGMMVYNTATVGDVTPGIYFNDGTKWVKAQSGTFAVTGGTNITVTGTGTALDPFKINTGKSTISQSLTTGVITHTNEAGEVKTANLISANAGNVLTIGTDGGAVLSSSAFPVVTSDNGLTKLGTNIQLGGELTKATTLVTDPTKTLAIRGLQTGALTDNVVIVDAGGVLKTISTASINNTTFDNGLTKAGTNVSLGGTLTKSTTLTTSPTNTLIIAGLQTGAATDKVVVSDAAGVLKTVTASSLIPATTVSNASAGNTATVTVNGVTSTGAPIINTNVLGLDATNKLTSTVNGIASSSVDLSAFALTANNGLTKTGTNLQLGGALTKPTLITADATNTLGLAGLQAGSITDKIVVADATGILKTVTQASLIVEPWNVAGTNNKATLNTQNIYQRGGVGIGDFSGINPIANLDVRGSIRGGSPSLASVGVNSFAVGESTEASGQASFAGGLGARATGLGSIALGGYGEIQPNIASGLISAAIGGGGNTASAQATFATGLNNTAGANMSFAAGEANTISSTGNKSFAMGQGNKVNESHSVVFGADNVVNNKISNVFGVDNISSSVGETVVGARNAITLSTGTGIDFYNKTAPIFQVGNGNYPVNVKSRNNALTLLRDGSLGIGITGVEAAARPTERFDVGSGNVRIRDINTVVGAAADKIVVADANGVLKTVTGASLIPVTAVSNSSAGNTATVTVNGVTSTGAPIINTNVLGLDATNKLTSTVNGIASNVVDLAPLSLTANNGLTKTGTNLQLGGALIKPTIITSDVTNTLALAGLQPGAITDQAVVADANGVLRKVEIDVRRVLTAPGVQYPNHLTMDAGVGQNGTSLGTGSDNIAFGYNAMGSNTTGFRNVAIGSNALALNTTGTYNIGIGRNALNESTVGTKNMALGWNTMVKLKDGTNNIALGDQALVFNTSGSFNISLGVQSGLNVQGSNNLILGYQAGFNTVGSGNMLFGYQTGYNHTGSNRLMIDNSATNTPLIDGDFVTRKLKINNTLQVADLAATALATTGNRPVVADANGQLMIGTAAATVTASNGLNKSSNDIQLGGALTKPTIVTSDATNTLALAGLQAGNTTDKIVVADATGILKTVTQASLIVEPWNVAGTNDKATLNTQQIYQRNNVGLGDFSGTIPIALLDVRGAIRGGYPSTASVGVNSFAVGASNDASGQSSAAIGESNVASGIASFAGGLGARATGVGSIAFGGYGTVQPNISSGFLSATMGGAGNTASAQATFAAGLNNTAGANMSFAAGEGNTISSTGNKSFAMGGGNKVNESHSVVFGEFNVINNKGSNVFGFQNISSSLGETVIGTRNAITLSTGTGIDFYDKTAPIFQVGSGNFPVNVPTRNNALTLLRNGSLGIGITGVEAAARPTERFDVGSGNVRVRDINTVTGLSTDKIVVADANGVLKTVAAPTGGASIATKTSAYTLLDNDETILVDATTGAVTITLPASPITGKKYNVKKIDNTVNAAIIDGNGKNIDGNASVSGTLPYQGFTVQFDGTNWFIISRI